MCKSRQRSLEGIRGSHYLVCFANENCSGSQTKGYKSNRVRVITLLSHNNPNPTPLIPLSQTKINYHGSKKIYIKKIHI